MKPGAEIEASRLRLKPGASDSGLEAQIEAWWLRLTPAGSDSSLEAQMEAWDYVGAWVGTAQIQRNDRRGLGSQKLKIS